MVTLLISKYVGLDFHGCSYKLCFSIKKKSASPDIMFLNGIDYHDKSLPPINCSPAHPRVRISYHAFSHAYRMSVSDHHACQEPKLIPEVSDSMIWVPDLVPMILVSYLIPTRYRGQFVAYQVWYQQKKMYMKVLHRTKQVIFFLSPHIVPPLPVAPSIH